MPRERALGRGASSGAGPVPLVHAHDHVRPEAGRAHPPALRRRGLPHDGVHRPRRGDGRAARGRAEPVHARHHRLREARGERADRLRVGSDRGLRQLARQAELQAVRLLLYASLRHLADGVDGDRAGELHKVVQGLHRHRQGDGALRIRQGRRRGRGAGDD